jgi:hypothetical protein
MEDGPVFLVGSRSSSNSLYRVVAGVAGLFFAGHTFGAIARIPYFDDAASAVRASMERVAFPCGGAHCTWFGFYLGFGIIVSVFLSFTAFLLWYMGGLPEQSRVMLRPIVVGLIVAYAVIAGVSKLYFFPAPLIFSLVIAAILSVIAMRFP